MGPARLTQGPGQQAGAFVFSVLQALQSGPKSPAMSPQGFISDGRKESLHSGRPYVDVKGKVGRVGGNH